MRKLFGSKFSRSSWTKLKEIWYEAFPKEIDIKERIKQTQQKAKLEQEKQEKEKKNASSEEQEELANEEFDQQQEETEQKEEETSETTQKEILEEFTEDQTFIEQAKQRIRIEKPKTLTEPKPYNQSLQTLPYRISPEENPFIFDEPNFGTLFKIYFKESPGVKISQNKIDQIEHDPNYLQIQQEIQNLAVGVDNIKDTLRGGMDKNIVLQKSKKAMSKIREKMNNEVLTYMRENHPDFDVEIFEKEIEYIFEQNFNAYLNHDLDTIRDTCLSEAFGFFSTQIEVETQKNAVHKHKAIFNVQKPVLEGSAMIQKQPLFIFSVRFHQIFALVNAQDQEELIEGSFSKKVLMDYLLYVIPHPEPNVQKTGHTWAFIKIYERNKVQLLV